MCSVCDAGTVLDGEAERLPAAFQRPGGPTLIVLGLPCEDAGAEFAPFRVLVQRRHRGERAPVDLVTGTDLAGFMAALGTDIKWEFVSRLAGGEVAAWLCDTKDPPEGADLPRRLRERYDWRRPYADGRESEAVDVALGVAAINGFNPPAAKAPKAAKPPRPLWQRAIRRWWWAISERVEGLLSWLDRRR